MKTSSNQNEFLLSNEGYCPICHSKSQFVATHPWLRDYYICETCKTCPRQRAMALILGQLIPNWQNMSIHEGSPCIPFFANECKQYSCSYYFPDIEKGSVDPSTGKRCENFEELTFPDDTFDILMHQDVLEHVFNPDKVMREAMRVLKPGGLHIFTVPKNKRLLVSEPRAKIENGQLRHIKPAHFHGDPKDPNGVLVTWDYGTDLEDIFSAFGGYLINTFVIRDRRYGIDGEYLDVFFSWKTPENQLTESEQKQLIWNWPHGPQYEPMLESAMALFHNQAPNVVKNKENTIMNIGKLSSLSEKIFGMSSVIAFCDETFVKETVKRYATNSTPPEFSYATVRDFCDSWDHLKPLSQHGDLKNVQRPWTLKAILSQIPIGGKLLEFGGGQPIIAATLARMGYDVTIVDPYDGTGNGPTEYERYVQEFPEVRLIKGYFQPKMTELSCEEGSFDAVYSISVIEHVPMPVLKDVFDAMQMYLRPTGLSIHAIDYICKGNGDDEHKTMLRDLTKLSGISEEEVDRVLNRMYDDIETYYLSAEAQNAWRMGLTYDEFPMRVCVSLQLSSKITPSLFQHRHHDYRGGIELLRKEYVSGYCFDANSPDKPVQLRILLNDIELGKTWANNKHQKYADLGIGNGRCGFYYPFGKSHQDLDLSQVKVAPVDCEQPLNFYWVRKKNKNTNHHADIYKQLTDEISFKASKYDSLFIVNHIPKTAGTSLRSSLESVFPEPQRFYHYNNVGACSPEIWRWKFAEQPDLTFETFVKIILEKQIQLIIGHFGFPERYGFEKLLSAFTNARSIVFLRDPCNHICSLYLYAHKIFGENKSFEEYIEQPYTQNYQSNALCGVSIEQLSFVGIVEQYNQSLEILYRQFGMKLAYERVNVNQGDKQGSYDYNRFGDDKVWARFKKLNEVDFALYQQAKERLERLVSGSTDFLPKTSSHSSTYIKRELMVPQFSWAKNLGKEEWAKALTVGQGPNGEVLPSCPSEGIQTKYVGASGHAAYIEAIKFIDKMKKTLFDNGLELHKGISILDCGVGWGRVYRTMLREVDLDSIMGVDIDPDVIQICKNAMPYGHFETINKEPPYLNLQETSFDLVYLYSVFSHLSEFAFKKMMTEFFRIIKSSGFLVFTTLKRAHLNKWNSLVDSEIYGSLLKAVGFDVKKWEQLGNSGNFLFVPSPRDDANRSADYYGQAIITEKFLNTVKTQFGFKLVLFEEPNDMPQAFVVLQKI